MLYLQSCQRDAACDVYRAYVRPRSSPVRRQLNQKIIADLDQFVQGNKVSAVEKTTDGLNGRIM